LTDGCWSRGEVHRCGNLNLVSLRDDQYDYHAVWIHRDSAGDWDPNDPDRARLRLSLDCDGDYLTSIQLEWFADGTRRASVDGLIEASPLVYAALTDPAGWTETASSDWLPLAEIAIPHAELPALPMRARATLVGPAHQPEFDPLPRADVWYPHARSYNRDSR